MSREIRLASRPKGLPGASNFTMIRTKLEPLRDQEVLVRNIFMSVDPYMLGHMNEGKSYVPRFELGKVLEGGEESLASSRHLQQGCTQWRIQCINGKRMTKDFLQTLDVYRYKSGY